jgi:hypothetical protein
VRKQRHFFVHFLFKMIILPRQALDKHRKNPKSTVFLHAGPTFDEFTAEQETMYERRAKRPRRRGSQSGEKPK